jgi:hypothetical protein
MLFRAAESNPICCPCLSTTREDFLKQLLWRLIDRGCCLQPTLA